MVKKRHPLQRQTNCKFQISLHHNNIQAKMILTSKNIQSEFSDQRYMIYIRIKFLSKSFSNIIIKKIFSISKCEANNWVIQPIVVPRF
ncbi:hypothetical protein BpHYR1_031034 [Brachionus plicatilis]|uniref:Uncharacterized protein n=1 Tax=Brachionus plicatilis TaxID=10195 RepID=A0A3M7Q2U8_BRAPC|nr:hypothetical protein BpHYR1_031034 [Brachionus plicatilis]